MLRRKLNKNLLDSEGFFSFTAKLLNMNKQKIAEESNKKITKFLLKFVFLPLVTLFTLFMIIGFVNSRANQPIKNVKPLLTDKQIANVKYDSIKHDREEKLKKSLTVFKTLIKERMKDPSSYKEIKRAYNPADSMKNEVHLQIQFQGDNSFGGRTVSVAEGTYNFKTDLIVIKDIFQL